MSSIMQHLCDIEKNMGVIKKMLEERQGRIAELEQQVGELVEVVRDCNQVFNDITEMGGVHGHILACMQEKIKTLLAKHTKKERPG